MRHPTSLSSQSGIALIAVLLFLILIMIVGAIAVRQAGVDLNVATSDQVGTLLLNNSDSVLAHIEMVAGESQLSTKKSPQQNLSPEEQAQKNQRQQQYKQIMSIKEGALGYFTVDPKSKVGDQISLCYRPTEKDLFTRSRAYTRPFGPNNSFISIDQSCNAASSVDYGSARNTAMTQIIVRGQVDELSDNFDRAATGTSQGGQTEAFSPKVQINSVSIVPSMSSKNADVIKECLGRPVGNAAEYGVTGGNLNDCLKRQNIPSTFVVEEGTLIDSEDGGYAGDSLKDPCQDNDSCRAAQGAPAK